MMPQNTPMRTDLTSLERLEAQIRALPDGTPQGAAWEAALVGWVNGGGHPDLVKGWGWKQWPGRAKAGLPRIERGVDLIAVDRAGRLVAIQAKFRNDPDSPVRTGEVQKFVGAYRKHFPRRMLISNASSRARGIKEAVGDTEAELVLRTDLIESPFNWITAKPVRPPKITPLPFQKEAAAAIKKHLKDGGRAQIVMACGSGKTYTTLLAMEALGSKRVLVLAPTLLLVKQLRDEWIRERTSTWATLAVCSDIGTDEGDDSTHVAPGELGSKPTTDPAVIASEIKAFVKAKLPYVVFGTYASSARIATAQKKAGVPAFDLVVADEAHRIAGAVGKTDKGERAQRVVLDEKGIRAERRLFATATPRVYGGNKKKDSEEIVLESMDDPERFGEEVYKLTFQQAVDLDRLVPYKLLVTIVTDDEVKALIRDRAYLDVDGKKISTDDLATAIAVRRAYKELGISRVISYHGSIKRARAFAQLVQEVKAPGKAPETECVTGSMAVEDRKEALTRLAQAEGPYLITNARCLTEGIDVPALDAVAFADPRRSQVDIVQAVGRAMRKPRGATNKTTGYIILPVFLSQEELSDPEAVVEGSAFAPVLQVLRALKAHDPYRATFFAKILAEHGKRPASKVKDIHQILTVSLTTALDRALAKRLVTAVQLRAIEIGSDRFEFWFALLESFVARNGHAQVLQYHLESGVNLGSWVRTMRSNKKSLGQTQIDRLDSLGFVWSPHDDAFERNFEALRRFVWREGHAQIPKSHVEGKLKLGTWVSKARGKRSKLSPDQVARLEAIGFLWDVQDETFESRMTTLQAFVAREGHARVPQEHIEHGVKLGSWVTSIRQRRSKLEPSQVVRLNAIGFVWDVIDTQFQQKLDLLKQFVAREGHALVPQDHVENGVKVGGWIANLRHRRSRLRSDQLAQLEGLGFVWNANESEFQRNMALLEDFVAHEGHANVPDKVRVNGVNLGGWAQRLRARREALTPDQILRLESIGFSWDPTGDAVRRNTALLAQFVAREGHARVPAKHLEDGERLGGWVTSLRSKKIRLNAEQLARLEELGFVWDVLAEQFERNLAALQQYVSREGHARVPQGHIEDGVRLGAWVNAMRTKPQRLNPGRIARLNKLKFIWKAAR
jgi:superfamily II DNA or RNA helicase